MFLVLEFDCTGKMKNVVAKVEEASRGGGGGRILISVSVVGSGGRCVSSWTRDEVVATVINAALKSYAREGRLPFLGTDHNDFLLYCANASSDGKRYSPPPRVTPTLVTFSISDSVLIWWCDLACWWQRWARRSGLVRAGKGISCCSRNSRWRGRRRRWGLRWAAGGRHGSTSF